MNKHYYIFLLSILIISCSDKEVQYSYYDNGDVEIEWIMENGKREGETKSYYENGEVKSIVKFSNDMRNGEAIYYFEGGQVSGNSYFIDDLESGTTYKYYPSGKLRVKANYRNDKPDSLCYVYSEEGNGYREEYYIEGELAWDKEYKNGKLIENKNVEFFTVTFDADTVRMNEMLTGEVHLVLTNLDKIRVILGNLDASGNLLDTLQVIEEHKKFKANFSVQSKDLGKQVFSGVIQEIHEKSGRYVLKPFRKEYFVIE